MRISAKGEYAVKAMLDLALCDDGETLQPIQDIARRQSIPQRYLEQVLLGLKRAGFLHSRRGSAGGYRLAKPPAQITVGALLRAVEGQAGVGFSGRAMACHRASGLLRYRDIRVELRMVGGIAINGRMELEPNRARVQARPPCRASPHDADLAW